MLEVHKSQKIEDGKHQGVIIEMENRDNPYKYTDIIIETEGIRLKYGCPTFVSEDSRLGKLLKKFGADLTVGGQVDERGLLIGKQVSFVTVNTTTDGKTYARIVEGSLMPFEEVAIEAVE